MKMILMLLICVVAPQWGICQTNSPAGESTNTLAQAKQKGETQAKADIVKGTMQILYYGKPWSIGKPLVDDQSQLAVEIVSGCCVTPDFVAETDAYNAVMRQAVKDKKEKAPANPTSDGIRQPADGSPKPSM